MTMRTLLFLLHKLMIANDNRCKKTYMYNQRNIYCYLLKGTYFIIDKQSFDYETKKKQIAFYYKLGTKNLFDILSLLLSSLSLSFIYPTLSLCFS